MEVRKKKPPSIPERSPKNKCRRLGVFVVARHGGLPKVHKKRRNAICVSTQKKPAHRAFSFSQKKGKRTCRPRFCHRGREKTQGLQKKKQRFSWIGKKKSPSMRPRGEKEAGRRLPGPTERKDTVITRGEKKGVQHFSSRGEGGAGHLFSPFPMEKKEERR